jgi:hypothetical protein
MHVHFFSKRQTESKNDISDNDTIIMYTIIHANTIGMMKTSTLQKRMMMVLTKMLMVIKTTTAKTKKSMKLLITKTTLMETKKKMKRMISNVEQIRQGGDDLKDDDDYAFALLLVIACCKQLQGVACNTRKEHIMSSESELLAE